MVKRAKEKGISSKETTDKIVEGWQRKAKGLLQVLWERGFINPTNVDMYTMNRKQDACRVLMLNTRLKLLISNCEDF
jgi:hypothetical protein